MAASSFGMSGALFVLISLTRVKMLNRITDCGSRHAFFAEMIDSTWFPPIQIWLVKIDDNPTPHFWFDTLHIRQW